MPQGNISIKQLMINKANGTMVAVTSIAAFLVVFCLVASVTLFGQLSYQNRVIGKKKVALNQLHEDIQNVDSLVDSYQAFSSTPQNVLNGNSDGTGPQDGSNAKIVLDALPSKYDFPALTSSLESIMSTQNAQIQGITGTDDEVAQSAGTKSSTPKPVEMPFEVTASGNYDAIKNVIDAFQRSIRPIQVQDITISASGDKGLTAVISAKTYYQPEKTLSIRQEVVR